MARSISTATFGNNASFRASSTLLNLFFIPGLLLASGAFVLQLSGADLSLAADVETGSLYSQIVLASFYFVAAVIFFSSGNATKILVSAWPILLVPLLAVASASWSDDPPLTIRRAFALCGTVLFGLSFASVFNFRTCVVIIVRVLSLAMVLSIIWAFVFPRTGIHQVTDAVQNIHAGYWRGIFAHRNSLGGEWGSITLALLLVYGQYAFKNWILRIGAIIATLICLAGANSGTGYVLAFTVSLVAFCLSYIAAQPSRWRLPLILFLLVAVAFLYVLSDEIFALILWSTGKTADLTGRTVIWHYVTQLIDSNLLLGRGYHSGFVTVDRIIRAVAKDSFGSAHNGYLEILVYFGYVGLTTTILVLTWLTWRAIRLILAGASDHGGLNTFPICIVIFALLYNTVESGLMTPNNLVTLLLATAAGMLARPKTTENLNYRRQLRINFRAPIGSLRQGR